MGLDISKNHVGVGYHSPIILGGAQLGLCYGITNGHFLSCPMLYQLLDKAYYLGFHSFDLAQAYGNAEQRLALWQHRRCANHVSFGTKILLPAVNKTDTVNALRRSRRQLKNLDYVLLHSSGLEQFQTLRTLCPKLKTGLSLYTPKELEQYLNQTNTTGFQILQVPYSVADRRFEKYFGPLINMGVELQLRSLYLQGLLLVGDITPYTNNNHQIAGLLPILYLLSELEHQYAIQRQDILLYAGLRHCDKFKSVRLVVGLSSPAEVLQLHYSLLRIAKWDNTLCQNIANQLDNFPKLGLQIISPKYWH